MEDYDFKMQPDVEYIYFLTGNGETLYFKCTKERHKYARSLIRSYLGDDGGWNEEVRQIFSGTVTHMVTQYNTTERPDEEEIDEEGCDGEGTYWGEFDYRCDFKLEPVESLRAEVLDVPLDENTDDSKAT